MSRSTSLSVESLAMKLGTRLILMSFVALLVPVLVMIAVAAAIVVERGGRSQELYFRSALARIRQDISDTAQRYNLTMTKLASDEFLTHKLYVYNKYWNLISNDTLSADIAVLKDELEDVLLSQSIDTIVVYRTDGPSYRSILVVGNSTFIPEVVTKDVFHRLAGGADYQQSSDGVYATFYTPVIFKKKQIGILAFQKAFNRGYFETLSLRDKVGIAFYAQGLFRYSSLPGISDAGVLWAGTRSSPGGLFSGSYSYLGRNYNYQGYFYEIGPDAKGFLFVGGESSTTAASWWREFISLLFIPLICVAVATVLFSFWGNAVIRRVRELLSAFGEVARGNYRVQLPIKRKDEFGDLFRGFTLLADNLKENARRLEENKKLLVNSERMAALGQFSAGVAHEINNPIGIVLNHVQLIRSGRLSRREEKEFLERVEKEIKRVTRLLNNLLHHASNDELAFADIDLAAVVLDVVQLFSPKLQSKGVSVETRPFPSQLCIEGDADAVKQVLFNLLYNALQAIHHDHGVIRVEGEEIDGGFGIRVRDNGEGMDASTKERLFEPFFTRKQGYGTGLGLALSRKIMKQHGGSIEVESEADVGTTVLLWFPKKELA